MAISSSPDSPILSHRTTPPWYPWLCKSYQDNYFGSCNQVYLSMSNLRRSGDASMHCLAFQAFLEDDPRFMEFLLAVNDNILMGDIKSDPNAQLSWMMPKTQEYYKFKGKFYIASAPIQVTRFPPPNVTDHASSASQYWEDERQRQWKALDPAVRATFTWPSRGEVPKMDPKAFACQRLEFPADTTASSDQLLHGIAMDNFCLLVFKIIQVEHFDHVTFPPQRKIYTYDPKKSEWSSTESNP